MRANLTSKQKEVLSTIMHLTHKKGSPPKLEELRNALKYPQISSVQRHTDALKEKGYLDEKRGLSLPIYSNAMIQIPLVGNIACGSPLLASENIEAYIPYNSSNIHGRPDDYFFLRAVGDSMNNTNIKGKNIDDGDYVLVKKQSTADYGSRVVALIGEEATIKKLERGEGCYQLMPESTNQDNKPLYIFDEFSIQGITVDIIKRTSEHQSL